MALKALWYPVLLINQQLYELCGIRYLLINQQLYVTNVLVTSYKEGWDVVVYSHVIVGVA